MSPAEYYAGIDLGAGEGAKIGIFAPDTTLLEQGLLPLTEYGGKAGTLAEALIARVGDVLGRMDAGLDEVKGIGLASPGLFRSDGSFIVAANLPFLKDQNLKELLREKSGGIPVEIDNDANSGALAEWSVLRIEILYWVFGGGWGGAWVSQNGDIRFPAHDWDGDDAHLHYTNEPGYAIPLEKMKIKTFFIQQGASYDRFEQILVEDLQPDDGVVRGPSDSPDHLRAEIVLSGPGRCRLFRAIVGDDDFYKQFLDMQESEQMANPTVAGKHISKLSQMRVEAAVETDRLFGRILAEACRILFKRARQDGLVDGTPICLGGKPSYALPYFGPSAQRTLGAMGILSYLRPSVIDERGSNANLVGAAVLAKKAAGTLD